MSVTIKDVAAKCGLSISTVSKAFNNYSDISSDTRKLVQMVAREIGYYPNAVARTLKTNRSGSIGVVFSDQEGNGLTHSFFASVLEAFKSESEKSGYDVTFINHNVSWAGMTYLEHCRYRNVDGVCVVCAEFYTQEMQSLVSGDIPCVTIDHSFNNRSCVMSENVDGMQQLVRYAAEMGHKRIAFVHGQTESSVTQNRLTGYYREMGAHMLPVRPEFVIEAAFDNPEKSHEAVLSLMRSPMPPTCIMLPDDHSSLGAVQAATELGLRIPQDLSIAGYDGIRLTQMLRPRLTTIRQDMKRIGEEAARCLIETIENPRTSVSSIISVPSILLKGESIGRVYEP